MNAMNEMALNQNDEEFLTYEVSDTALEGAAACLQEGKSKQLFTQWMCTALFVCPGP